ncbi:MAG: hypothetical protein ACRCXA_10420 [Peptostreptococcaceae bacterium]
MQEKIITDNKIFLQPTKVSDTFFSSTGYEDFHSKILEKEIALEESKSYDLLPSGFIDFNQHLYKDINHMNSISSGLFIEKTLITFRIFIWTSRGEGFEIFKHVLRGSEINMINSLDDAKKYVYSHLDELEKGINETYNSEETNKSFEEFGKGIEAKKLPLASILKYLSIDNNISDLK